MEGCFVDRRNFIAELIASFVAASGYPTVVLEMRNSEPMAYLSIFITSDIDTVLLLV